MPAFTEPPEAGRVSGAVLLHLLAAPFDLSLPWGVLGGLPSCHVVTSTSGTELDLHELFHTSTNPPPPRTACRSSWCPGTSYQQTSIWRARHRQFDPQPSCASGTNSGKTKTSWKKMEVGQGNNMKAEPVGRTITKKLIVAVAADPPPFATQTRLTFTRTS